MAQNKGETFRLKLERVINRFGFDVIRFRESYQDQHGIGYPPSTIVVRVIDTDQVSQRYANITQSSPLSGYNEDNPDLIQILYAAEAGVVDPETIRLPLIEENDQLHFNGFVHTVTRQKPLPIDNVYVYRHVTCIRTRLLPR